MMEYGSVKFSIAFTRFQHIRKLTSSEFDLISFFFIAVTSIAKHFLLFDLPSLSVIQT